MQREFVLQTLRSYNQEMSTRYGVTRLGIFGSVARDQATDASDVDIVVEMPPDLFKMVYKKEDLEAILATPVDLIRYSRFLNAAWFIRSSFSTVSSLHFPPEIDTSLSADKTSLH